MTMTTIEIMNTLADSIDLKETYVLLRYRWKDSDVGFAAHLSNSPKMIAHYTNGDFYTAFAHAYAQKNNLQSEGIEDLIDGGKTGIRSFLRGWKTFLPSDNQHAEKMRAFAERSFPEYVKWRKGVSSALPNLGPFGFVLEDLPMFPKKVRSCESGFYFTISRVMMACTQACEIATSNTNRAGYGNIVKINAGVFDIYAASPFSRIFEVDTIIRSAMDLAKSRILNSGVMPMCRDVTILRNSGMCGGDTHVGIADSRKLF